MFYGPVSDNKALLLLLSKEVYLVSKRKVTPGYRYISATEN